MILASWPIIIGLTWLTTGRNLIRLKRVWLQFIVFISISLVLFIRGYSDMQLASAVLLASLPYLFFITIVLILVILLLDQDYYPYLPICILTPHFVMAALLYASNENSLLILQPIMLSCVLWYITIPASIFIFVALMIVRVVRLMRRGRVRKNPHPSTSARCQNPQCGIVFYRGTFPGDFPDRCPKCRHSATEQSLKKST